MIYKNIKIRDNTMDKFIVDEMSKYGDYEHIWNVCKDAVVLDIGGNIGAFANKCFELGAKEVISVEPEIDNFNLLCENSSGININKAVTTNSGDYINLFINPGINKGTHSILPIDKDGVCTQLVTTISLLDLIDKYKPSVVKIDIEGGEYQLAEVLSNLPECVKHIAIEFDSISNSWIDIIQSLLSSEFIDSTRNHFFSGRRI